MRFLLQRSAIHPDKTGIRRRRILPRLLWAVALLSAITTPLRAQMLPIPAPAQIDTVAADTLPASAPSADSTRMLRADSLGLAPGDTLKGSVPDSLATAPGDTLAPIDPELARWFPTLAPAPVWSLPPRKLPGINQNPLPFTTRSVRLEDGRYLLEYRYGDRRYGLPIIREREEYAELRIRQDLAESWANLQREQRNRLGEQRGLLDFSLTIPGGRQSAFTTIFGTPEVNLRVNGTATMNVGASIQKSEDPFLPPDQQTRVDPTFDQNLQLNIQGTIGDKLTIQTDWDTERQFDFQNRLRIAYTGYDDEIIKNIEMGNVSMQTGNSLIRGGGALFGIKSIVEMGPLRFTSIVSQQKGDSNVETLSGGSQEQAIQIRPADYENDRHFFLDFHTRQRFEQSLANPQQLRQTLQIADVNVWILKENIQTEEGARRAVALVDYGVAGNPDGSYAPPSNQSDPFDDGLIESFRDPTLSISASDLGVSNEADFETGFFSLLQEGIDYTVNKVTGTVSLRRRLGAREVLAVAFSYVGPTGQLVQVGDVNRGGSDRVFLKMLRPKNVSTENKVFDLTMRNVYSLGVSGVQSRENLEIEIQFTEGNVAQNQLPGRNRPLMQDLGLDRVDEQGALTPDNQVDFGTGTLDLAEGRIMFPYLEPFGARMRDLLEQAGAAQEEIDRLVYVSLYSERPTQASQDSRNNFYRIDGTAKGGVQDSYSLGFALVEGSVRVTANGVELSEGSDYQVDYAFGNITILNQQYTAPGQEIRIEYENQAFTTIEQKTFAGMRAEYTVSPNIAIGGTLFRYNEKPLDDKIRIGDEPISNTVLGLDATADFDMPFVTRAIDFLPLLQTKEPSNLKFSGEFAQLRPGVAQTRATAAAIDRGDLYRDEELGLSFIDDFEGANIKVSLLNATRWSLASAPAALPGYAPDVQLFAPDAPLEAAPTASLQSRVDRADLRSDLAWYSIPRNIGSILGNVQFTPESRPVRVTDVFPGKETQNPQEEFITTLDLHFAPDRRGPYAYPAELGQLYGQQPERTWGGMTAVLPSGQEDFTQNNIEFLEFWVQPVLPGGADAPAADLAEYEGTLYIDLGILSEDVVPNSKLNSEDGLATNQETLQPDNFSAPRSVVPSIPPAPLGQFSNQDRDIEDVGLDGLPNTGGVNEFNEQVIFSDFIEIARRELGEGSEAFQQLQADPSNDDYVYYGESKVSGLPLHEKFHRMLGRPDGNTPLNQGEKRAVTNRPDTEGLINPSIVEQNNAYYQYEVRFNPADRDRLQPGASGAYIVDRVDGPSQVDRWYLVRVPLTDFKRKYGDISTFQNISYTRLWMSGYGKPFTLRFATFEFVGSQWRKAEQQNLASDPAADIKISSINIEENGSREPIPYRQPSGGIRAVNRGAQLQSLANEQSLVLQVENLGPQGVQLVKKVVPGGLNLINYSNMRMFLHGEGYQRRQDVELVIRLGTDLENNYYEYRQPVTPTDPDHPFQPYDPDDGARMEEEAALVWLYEENSMNLVLSAFNALKQLRDQLGGDDPSQVFERGGELLEGSPPGAVLAIKGNPSLTRVSEIGLGIRNPYDVDNPDGRGVPVLDASIWLNELRVSGFDNEKGWAASVKGTAKLADFATLNANFSRQTNGFGALDSRLGQRRTSELLSYDLSTNVQLDKFLPARYGWRIPVSVTARSSVTTPKYLPDQGDIRFSDFEDAVRSRDDLAPEEQSQLIDQRLQSVQTVAESFSVNLSNLSKTNSESKLAQATLDNTSINFVYNTGHNSSPEVIFRDTEDLNASIRYAIQFRNVKMISPLRFLESVPVLKSVSGLQLGVMPTNIGTNFAAKRNYSESRRRGLGAADSVLSPLQQTHNFNYNTSFSLGYRLTPSINTGFQSRSAYDLGQFSVRPSGLTGVDSAAFRMVPTFDVVRHVLEDSIQPRRSTYDEEYTASWQPKFNTIKALNWLTYSTRYSGGFRWENSPVGSGLGAKIGNSMRLDHTLRIDAARLTDRLGFYKKWKQADTEAAQERKSIREEREKVKEEIDRLKEQQRERERLEREERERLEREERERLEQEEAAGEQEEQPQEEQQEGQHQEPQRQSPQEESESSPEPTAPPAEPAEQPAEPADPVESPQQPAEQPAEAPIEDPEAPTRRRRPAAPRQDAPAASEAPAESPRTDSTRVEPEFPEIPRIAPFDHVTYVGRKLFMLPLSFRSFDVNYSQNRSGAQAGYAGGAQLAQALMGGASPTFLYRIGVDSKILGDEFILNSEGETSLQLPGSTKTQDNLTLGTSLSPFKNLSVDLNWSAQWDDDITETVTLGIDNTRSVVRTQSGTSAASVWAFGSGYEAFFRNQLRTAFDDITPGSGIIRDSLGNGDSRTVLNPVTLERDFRSAYLLSGGTSLGDKGFMPIPLPQWRVNWSGLESSVPFLGRFMSRATLSHSYQGRYRLGWTFNNDAGQLLNQSLGAYTLEYLRSDYDPNSVNIERRFSPLVQLTITWKNNMRTTLGIESSKTTSLALSNTQVTEKSSKGMKFSLNYTIRDFKLPFLRKVNNNVDFTLNGSFLEDIEQRYQLGNDLSRALEDPQATFEELADFKILSIPPTGQARINGSAVIGYRFSSTMQANFEYAYSKILPRSSRTFERTTHDIRFNIRINIRSN